MHCITAPQQQQLACKLKIHGIEAASCAKFGGYNIATKAGLNQIHHPLQHRKIQLGQENS
jgi:hypothetical protein